MKPPLISSQRYLDPGIVHMKAMRNDVFIVHVVEMYLRGRLYRVLIDGHHNLAAAKIRGEEPKFRPPAAKWVRIQKSTPSDIFEKFIINNLTDSDWYYVDSGKVVEELL